MAVQVTDSAALFLALDLLGTFAFALNGALTAVRVASVDIVGVIVLGMITAMGGGIVRDLLLGDVPPATFGDWRYLAVAAGGALVAFGFSEALGRLSLPIEVLDAAGLGLFAVTGAAKALDLGAGPAQAVILGTVTAIGGGTLRDVLVRRVPTVLSSDLYAVPAFLGALLVVVATVTGLADVAGPAAAVVAALACFALRMAGVRYRLRAPRPPVRGGRPAAGREADEA